MLDLLRQWLKNIVVIMVLTAYIKFLLPEGQLKSYTRLVLSLLVMLIIIQPVVWMIRGSDDLVNELNQIGSWFNVREERANVRVKALNQDDMVLQVYKQDLVNTLQQDIEAATGQHINQLAVEIEEDCHKKTFGYLKNIHIVFASPKKLPLSNRIEPITVDLQQSSTVASKLAEQESMARQEVEAMLSYKYGVKDVGIKIKFIN